MLRRYVSLRYLKNKALRALLIGDAMSLVAAAMFTPIYAIYISEIGGDIFEAGITASALAFGAGIASIIGGRYTDRVKDKRLILVGGYAIVGVGFLLYTQVSSVAHLAIVQLLMGLVQPIYQTAFDALYSIHLDPHEEAQEWGAWEATAYFAAGIGAIAGSAFVAYFSFTGLFVLMSALSFASAIYVARLPRKLL